MHLQALKTELTEQLMDAYVDELARSLIFPGFLLCVCVCVCVCDLEPEETSGQIFASPRTHGDS